MVKINSRKHYYRFLKNSFIVGAGDDDPSGVTTYIQVGALTGFSQLWLLFLSTPMLIAVQEMASRIGIISRKGLSKVLKENFGFRWAALAATVVLLCNVATIGADIAVVSEAFQIFTGIDWQWFVIPLAFLLFWLLIHEKYQTISGFLLFLTPFLLAYVLAGLLAGLDWQKILISLFIPHVDFSLPFWTVAVALLGTTISPYLIYWQVTEEVEERISPANLARESKGVYLGMIYSNLISFFIIVSASLLGGSNKFVESASLAALALKPLAGAASSYLFAFGIIVAGILAVPILAASAAYALSGVFGWKEGLDKKVKKAQGFYLVLVGAVAAGALMALFGIAPMKMLLYSQVLNGILTPILVVFLLLVSNNGKIMGPYKNGWFLNIFGGLAVIVMVLSSVMMLISYLVKQV